MLSRMEDPKQATGSMVRGAVGVTAINSSEHRSSLTDHVLVDQLLPFLQISLVGRGIVLSH